MIRFFDGEDDLAHHLTVVKERLWPILELLDGEGEKHKTALFILMTRHAIEANGLRREVAHTIIEGIFDAIGDPEVVNRNEH